MCDRWDELRKKATATVQRTKHLAGVREDYDATRRTLLQWLHGLDLHLQSLAVSTDSSDIRLKLRNLKVTLKELMKDY